MCIDGKSSRRENQPFKPMFYQHSINQVKGAIFLQSLFGNRRRTYDADSIRRADLFGQGDNSQQDTLNLDHPEEQAPREIMFDMESGSYLEVGQNGRKSYFTLNGFERTIASPGHNTPMTIMGTDGANRIETGDGNDYIQGRGGHDALLGHGGNDVIQGGSGNDWITGGTGVNHVYGGAGRDTFAMTEGQGSFDIVKDFEDGVDKLWIRSAGNLRVVDGHSDAYVLRNNDLLAVVQGAAGDLEIGAGGITVI